MNRREFVLSGCGFCAMAKAGVATLSLESCSAPGHLYKTTVTGGKLTVPVAEMAGKNQLIVRSTDMEFDLLLVKKKDETFHALSMQCTHRQAPLSATSTGLVCNEHGSRFDLDGKVLQDPATKPLRVFRTELTEQNIIIHLT